MQIIKELADSIEEELEGSEQYIKKAIKYKNHDKELADMYYAMSLQEEQHAMELHKQGARQIELYKKEGHEIPADMQAIYDYLHERHIEKHNRVKLFQSQYNV